MSIVISIHALRKESDQCAAKRLRSGYISIHALRKESDVADAGAVQVVDISIHALRKESDAPMERMMPWESEFQSTLSVRRATLERDNIDPERIKFQSTLSVRRATHHPRMPR